MEYGSDGRRVPSDYDVGMPGRRLIAMALTALLVAGACAPTAQPSAPAPSATQAPSAAPTRPASPTPRPTPPPARWSDCGGGFQCATVVVPRDHRGATGGVVNIALVRRSAPDRDKRIGSLLVNPGGPGASGVEFVRNSWQVFPDELMSRFDLVGFDPRGVNASTGIRCIDNLDPRANLDPSPDDEVELQALLLDAETYAGLCARRNAELLPFLSTDDVVADLDLLRASLGDEELTYLGFSYGSLIGSLYADRFPDRVRAIALDGALDPSHDLVDVRTGQAAAFEAALGRFLADCAARTTCAFNHGADTPAAFDALMAAIDATPLPASRTRDRRKVGPGLTASAVLAALYSRAAWPALEYALALAELGDGSLLLLLSDPFRGRKPNGSYSNQIDAYTANICLDYPVLTDPQEYTDLAARLADAAPHFAQHVAYNDLACAWWPVAPTRTPGAVRAAGAPPIVVVGTTGDPATPFAWAESLAGQLASGVLVRHEGEGHTGFASSTCVQDLIADYLVTVEPPNDGTVCRD
jgi:pimeloyl-ACP methyl ester carboxylesterase